MADSAIFIGWQGPRAGREAQAGELFGATLEFYQSKVSDGTIESYEPVILQQHGGDLNGFFLIKGEQASLAAFRQSDDFIDWSMKAGYCLDRFGVVEGYVGAGLQDIMGRWMKSIAG